MKINIGPQHPSTHGVFRAVVTLDGETIVDVDPVVGYLHRNHEKIYEGMEYPMITPMTDRTDYLSAITNEFLYCLTVEKALGVEVPERGQYIRVIFAELQRILSHQIYFGTFGLDLGAFTPFLYAFRDREMALELMDRATGARLLYGYFRLGGVRNDLPEAWFEDLSKYLDYLEREGLPELRDLLLNNEIFRARTVGVGVLPPDVALAHCASGPVLRASGVAYDLRKAQPYGIYDRFEFDVPVGANGDSFDRCWVRYEEMLQSIRIIRQALRDLPDGPVGGQLPRGKVKLPKG
ncbi:MAG: NADH-quinone oxidoreductase subunit D, partial [Clostridia bacterium]|nr:NADH-quinone oxidoreductase subunit D [Clostridia bacterium]